MAVLHKIKEMNDTQIQNWLRKVGQVNAARLGIAMLGADEDVRNLIYKNMSDRAVSVLKSDLEKNRQASIDEKVILNYAAELEKMM
jgi:flagellar motor switch protein FliG